MRNGFHYHRTTPRRVCCLPHPIFGVKARVDNPIHILRDHDHVPQCKMQPDMSHTHQGTEQASHYLILLKAKYSRRSQGTDCRTPSHLDWAPMCPQAPLPH
jgi:hypothetical protein